MSRGGTGARAAGGPCMMRFNAPWLIVTCEPPTPNRMTNTNKNITFPQLLWREIIIVMTIYNLQLIRVMCKKELYLRISCPWLVPGTWLVLTFNKPTSTSTPPPAKLGLPKHHDVQSSNLKFKRWS